MTDKLLTFFLERKNNNCLPGSHLECHSQYCPFQQNSLKMLVPCGLEQWLKIVAEDGKIGLGHIYFLYYFHYFYQLLANVKYPFTVPDWSITFTETFSFKYILINNICISKNQNSVMTCCGNEKFTLKCEKNYKIYICDVQMKTCAK